MRLKWEVHAVFKVLNTLKTLANFLQLFCQFHGIPQRGPNLELISKQLVKIDLAEVADYFIEIDDSLLTGPTSLSSS
eukprot:15426267-Alexandrium_andersonii.AAC.1